MTFDLPYTQLFTHILTFLIGLAVSEFKIRRTQTVEEQKEVKDWYTNTAELARDIRILWESEYEDNSYAIQYDEIKKQMKLRGRKAHKHISSSAAKDIDQELVDELDDLGRLCKSLSDIFIGIGGDSSDEFKEKGEEIIKQAEKVEDLSLEKSQE